MAKIKNLYGKSESRRHHKVVGNKLSSHCLKNCGRKNKSKAVEKKEWVDVTCSVCMEYPHRAVLLLCSSYEKGCRPYMCSTSHRYSNCLEQYKKAYSKATAGGSTRVKNTEDSKLLCPLCRGQVKGWTVVEPVRKYFNRKKRACTQENCSFVGTYRKLRKHVRLDHPCSRPREVDQSSAEKWKKFEYERDLEDVISTIRSSMPGSIVMGDYVIEGGIFDDDDEDDIDDDDDDDDEDDFDDDDDDEDGDDDDDEDMEAYIDNAVFRRNFAISQQLFERTGYLWNGGHIINGGGGSGSGGSVGDGFLPRFNRYRSRFLARRPARRLDEVRSTGSSRRLG
ncbi:uncharacterized protein LOC124926213 [Impatiens glandulifera]|uniref:uncharacterized protein LOC124926213 n=1 Tax=Impatiens glandulifera TaxID=253017 RepID=UPI001FB08D85|nr:uncharacterized protein LOC124926213 [Impatiens glandulifera]XP_047322359.1 uncharacterized protein LOC124926213 [Impatiens glandulifera]